VTPEATTILDRLAFPLRLEYLSVPTALAIFCALAGMVVYTGSRSLRWLGPTRQWVAIGVRLCVIWFVVLLLAGAHWQQRNKDVEVMVLRDVSASTLAAGDESKDFNEFLEHAAKNKPAGDRIGVVGFDSQAMIDVLPDTSLRSNPGRAQHTAADGTDIAGAIQTGLASFHSDARKRLVLISDGNATQGSTNDALAAASSLHIPIDVIPMTYRIAREVMLERIASPTSIREGEPFSIDVYVKSTSALRVPGRLSVTDQDAPLDLNPEVAGVQASIPVELAPGTNSFRVKVPPSHGSGIHLFRASFIADNQADDQLTGNNVAESFTFVRGHGQVLYVDNTGAPGSGNILLDALRAQGIEIPADNHIRPDQLPARLVDLQPYDAIILANVSIGPGGLTAQQDRILAQYVHELGGGLLVIGGPETLGAGNWQGSELEKVVPVNMEIPAERVLPAGALVLVLDHSGSMSGPMPGAPDISKQTVANQSAILALQTLQRDDWLGMIAFDDHPSWIINLGPNRDASGNEKRIHSIAPAGGTAIVPALESACDQLARLGPKDVASKRILLMTDGQSSPGNLEAAVKRLRGAKVTVSTIAVGADADRPLLARIAQATGGAAYSVDSPKQLTQVFIREARTLRRQLIHEPPGGIIVAQTHANDQLIEGLAGEPLPLLNGMVLTSVKPSPLVSTPLITPNRYRDPILSEWQSGLGRAAVFTADATKRWAPQWVASPVFGKFWAQLVRTVQRPAMSGDFEITTVREGNRTRLIVEATDRVGDALSFFSFAGRVAGPRDTPPQDLVITQTGPGRYETTFDSHEPGSHVAGIQFSGPNGQRGSLLAGVSTQSSIELRDLQSNDAMLADIANRTGGRLLPSFEHGAALADLFTRDGLSESTSSRPITDGLLVTLVGMILLDVAVRRIAWDWKHMKQMAFAGVAYVRSYTTAPQAQPAQTLENLKKVHEGVATTTTAKAIPNILTSGFAAPAATSVADEKSKRGPERETRRAFHTGGLLEAKRRAQQQITDMKNDPKQ
jgi:Mg-chelatase subunit ChlD